MNEIKRNIRRAVLTLAIALPMTATASPAYRGVVTVEEPDGTVLELRVHGDEHFNYVSTTDGYAVRAGADGLYYYLDSDFRPTSLRAASADATQVRRMKSRFDPGEAAAREKARLDALRTPRGSLRHAATKAGRFPSQGEPHTLVILARFADEGFRSFDPAADYREMLNGDSYTAGGATGSCRRYYSDNSMGKFNPTFDVYGPVTLEHGYHYYGENNSLTGQDLHATDMVIEACRALDDEIDYTQYDLDGDGVIDNVYVVYAGYGASDSGMADRIWPHSYNFANDERRVWLDGKMLGNYACSNEINFNTGRMTGIGTFVHEFGHCLGLPDMYNTVDQSTTFTPGEWDFMDYGMYNNGTHTPPCVTAYERMFLGWLEPVELVQPDNLSLGHIAGNTAYMISTNLPDEYFLLENRQPEGWDAFIPGHGMLVWHIDYVKSVWDENRVNTNPSHQYVDILEADNHRSLDDIAGDPFPGTSGKTAITDETQPSLRTWLGLGFDKTVTDISESADGIITFRYRGGATLSGAPESVEVTDITPTSFKAVWSRVEGADRYIVNLTTKSDGMPAGNYGDADAGDVTEYTFAWLDPSTAYELTVKAADTYTVTAPSGPVEILTLPPTFDLMVPQAPELKEVTDNSATISVGGLAEAGSYLLSIYTKTRGESAATETLGFDNAATLPEGWTSTSSQAISMSGYHGEAAPALVLSADGMYIQTPSYPGGVTSLSFWLRGRSNVTGNTLAVFGYDGRRWLELTEMDIPREGSTVELDPDLLEGTYLVRMTYMKKVSGGNAVIDDIKIGAGASLERVCHEGYDRRDVGPGGEVKVEGLKPHTVYYASCTAINGALTSLASPETRFTTSGGSSVGTVEGDLAPTWGLAGDLIEIKCSPATVVTLYNVAGMALRSVRSDSDGTASLPLPSAGVYIVSLPGATFRVMR